MIELISIHIPKTAGRSFLSILHSVYGSEHIAHFEKTFFPDKSVSEIQQFTSALSGGVLVIHGHFQYKEIKELHRRNNSKVIAWLRNPVERVISNYSFFMKRIRESPDDAELDRRKNETLLEYAALENSRNRMTKFMDGLELNRYFFIGITENFESDVRELASMLNWGSIDIPRINDNSGFKHQLPPVTDEQRKIIAELNREDLELYRTIVERKNNRIN